MKMNQSKVNAKCVKPTKTLFCVRYRQHKLPGLFVLAINRTEVKNEIS